jgi:hypothetical protein
VSGIQFVQVFHLKRWSEAFETLGFGLWCEKVKKLRKAFAREEKTRKGLPLELKQKVSLEILQRLHDLGEGSNTTEQQGLYVSTQS